MASDLIPTLLATAQAHSLGQKLHEDQILAAVGYALQKEGLATGDAIQMVRRMVLDDSRPMTGLPTPHRVYYALCVDGALFNLGGAAGWDDLLATHNATQAHPKEWKTAVLDMGGPHFTDVLRSGGDRNEQMFALSAQLQSQIQARALENATPTASSHTRQPRRA